MVAPRFLSRPASHIKKSLVYYLLSKRSFKNYYVTTLQCLYIKISRNTSVALEQDSVCNIV